MRSSPLARLVCLALIQLLAVGHALAAPLDDALGGLTGSNYETIAKGVEALAQSGDPRAEPIVRALSQGRLLVGPDKTLFIKPNAGSTGILVAKTGAPAPADLAGSALKPVRVNNRVRNAIGAALGALTLQAADPAQRLAAARSVYASHDRDVLPAVEAALAHEKDSTVKAALEGARAAIQITSPQTSEADRVAAVKAIADRGDQDALALLRSLPPDSAPAVKSAANEAAAAIERHLALLGHAQDIIYGISLGSVLLLAAIGLAITFGVMGVINMAHGEMVMLGAYATFVVQQFLLAHAPALSGASVAIAIPLAFGVAGLVGIAIERTIIRFLYGRPLETLLATWGLSLILQQGVRSIFGPTNREVGTPDWLRGAYDLGGLSLTYNRIAIVIFALVVFGLLQVILNRTSLGLQIRAVTQNRRMASAMGIKTDWVDAMTFGLGSGVAGIAGVALSQIDNVSPNLGQGYIIDSFLVVVFGGVGNLWGTLVGAATIGIANKLLEPFAGAVLGKILLLVAVILFIQKRPRGLFALKGRFVEA